MSTAPTYKPLEIEVTDFGPIAKAKVELRPLTVFVGPSNTGKSYLAMLITRCIIPLAPLGIHGSVKLVTSGDFSHIDLVGH